MSTTADKQEMKSYLLGTLDSNRKTQLEERILSFPETCEELAIAEAELIDRYAAGGLSQLERQQFETHFLITAERYNNLRFGQLLNRYVNSHSIPVAQKDSAAAAIRHVETSAPAKSSKFSLLPSRPLMAFGVTAGVFFLGLVLFGWFAFRKPPSRWVQRRSEPVVVITLAPGSNATEGATAQRVNVPPQGYNVKLELALPNPSFHNYKSELFREDKPVQTSSALRIEAKGQQYVVPVTITGETLSPGDYQVKLSGVSDSGANEFVDKYSFRVVK